MPIDTVGREAVPDHWSPTLLSTFGSGILKIPHLDWYNPVTVCFPRRVHTGGERIDAFYAVMTKPPGPSPIGEQ